MLKVIFFAPRPFSLTFGGSEIQLLETKAALEALGISVEFANYFSMDQISKGSVVHLFGSDYIFAQLSRLLKGKGVPYVVSPIFYPIGLEKLAHKISSFLPTTAASLRKNVLLGASRILPNSKSEARLLADVFSVPQNLISVVPNGVSESIVGDDPEDFRRRYLPELAPDERFILSVGRIERRKNSISLLRAAARIKAPIVFVGSPNMLDSERKYVGQFEGELESYPGYVKHIKFLSPGSRDLANAYAGAHVHALVSWVETPGLANLEAGINGANLVVGESPPVREYLDNYATFVCQQETEKISIALEEALSQKRDSRSQSSFIRNNYSWSRVSSMLVSIYYQTLKGLG